MWFVFVAYAIFLQNNVTIELLIHKCLSHYEHYMCFKWHFFKIFGCAGSHCSSQTFSSCGEWRLLFILQCTVFSRNGFSCCRAQDSRHMGFNSCSTWTQQLWRTCLTAPWLVEDSQTRDRTHVPCIARRILIH